MMSENKYSAFRLIYFTGHKMNILECFVRCSIPNLVKCSEIKKKKNKRKMNSLSSERRASGGAFVRMNNFTINMNLARGGEKSRRHGKKRRGRIKKGSRRKPRRLCSFFSADYMGVERGEARWQG